MKKDNKTLIGDLIEYCKLYWREAFEVMLILGVILIIGTVLPPLWLQSHLVFCVFFFVVFVIAIRRYALTTYVVGSFLAGYYAFLLWQHPQISPGLATPLMFIEPFLLFVSSLIIGDVSRSQKRQLVLMKQQQTEKEALLEEMRQRYQVAQINNTELERRITEQTVSVSTVSEKMAALWTLHGQQRYDAIVDFIMHAINANVCALYISSNGRMTLRTYRRRDAHEHRKTVDLGLDPDDPIISRAMCDRRVHTIRDVLADGQPTRQMGTMMAGPFVDHHNKILGIVVVNDIPLLTFLPSTVHLFESLLHMLQALVQDEMSSKKLKFQFLSPKALVQDEIPSKKLKFQFLSPKCLIMK